MDLMRIPRPGRRGLLVVLVAAISAACSGDDTSGTASTTNPGEAAPPAEDEPTGAATTGSVTPSTTDPTHDSTTMPNDAGAGSVVTVQPDETEPTARDAGSVGYRVVNLLAEPVDVYVRTQGVVEAFEIRTDVRPGDVTELAYPPPDGSFVVTTAGAGDPECVVACDHVLVDLTAFPDDGDVHTVLLHDADGTPGAYDLWEEPAPGSVSANAMVAPDPAAGRFVVIAVDLAAADFGLRLSLAGAEGCAEAIGSAEVLVGGTQTPAFAYDGETARLVFHDSRDRDCTGAPVGGPFVVAGGPGTRTHVMLTGTPGAMDALVVPFVGPDEPSAAGEPPPDDRAARAVELMTDELAAELGIDAADAACLAPYVVDAIGVDAALVDGALIDLDRADEATRRRAFEGLIFGFDACGVEAES